MLPPAASCCLLLMLLHACLLLLMLLPAVVDQSRPASCLAKGVRRATARAPSSTGPAGRVAATTYDICT